MNVGRAVIRTFATNVAKPQPANIEKGYFELRKIQERFQKPDGKPVFLKGGMADQVLYRLTMGLCVVALAGIELPRPNE